MSDCPHVKDLEHMLDPEGIYAEAIELYRSVEVRERFGVRTDASCVLHSVERLGYVKCCPAAAPSMNTCRLVLEGGTCTQFLYCTVSHSAVANLNVRYVCKQAL